MHDEENCALVSKVKKGKGKVSLSESSSSSDGKKVDKSKVRYPVKAHTINLCTRNTLFSRILDQRQLSF